MGRQHEPWYERCPQEAREIIGQISFDDGPTNIYQFDGLSVDNLRLLIQIGAVDPNGRQNDSPTAAAMLKIGEDHPGTLFSGYRVSDGRFDRRISLETIHIPIKESVPPAEFDPRLLDLMQSADECSEEDGMLRLWWD